MIAWLTPFRVEAAFWLALLGGLGAAVGIETDWGQRLTWPLPTNEIRPASFTAPDLAEPFHMQGPENFLDIAMKPLFVVTRRPAPNPPPPEPPKPQMMRNQFVLTGTTIVPEGKFAHLQIKAGGKSQVIAEGREINGIVVKEIHPERVVLTQHGDSETLVLTTAKAPPLPPPQPHVANPATAPNTNPVVNPENMPAPGRRPGRARSAPGDISAPAAFPAQ